MVIKLFYMVNIYLKYGPAMFEYRIHHQPTQEQGTYTLGRFSAHASILCTVMGADQNKESFPFPGVGSTCLCYRFSQKSAYTFCVNDIRIGAAQEYLVSIDFPPFFEDFSLHTFASK